MVFVTHIHLVGGDRHDHIDRVRWRNPITGKPEKARERRWSTGSTKEEKPG
jgi:hypothetical protein